MAVREEEEDIREDVRIGRQEPCLESPIVPSCSGRTDTGGNMGMRRIGCALLPKKAGVLCVCVCVCVCCISSVHTSVLVDLPIWKS